VLRRTSDTPTIASGLQLLVSQERLGLPLLHRTRSDGHVEVAVLEAGDDRLTIGRAADCDVIIDDDAGVSRTHLELIRLGDGWVVEDRGLSRNGTWVDDERLDGRRRLADAQRVRVGHTVLEYRAGSGSGSAVVDVTVPVTGQAAPSITAAQRAVLVAFVRPILSGAAASPAGNADIAAALVISPETVKSHLKDLYERFGLEGVAPAAKRAELAARAVRLGVVGRADL
jgi:pSer/pThr/pTyr-binding forkhead associated (FHA) protein